MVGIGHPDCSTQLDEDAIRAYWDRGYIVFENALSPTEVNEATQALFSFVERAARTPADFEISEDTRGKSSQSGTIFRSIHNRMFFQLERGIAPKEMSPYEQEYGDSQTSPYRY